MVGGGPESCESSRKRAGTLQLFEQARDDWKTAVQLDTRKSKPGLKNRGHH